MAKGTEDALLRIRAKNLASQALREVRTELDKLNDKQKENADAALLAKRKIKDLRTEYDNLRVIEKELARRSDFAKKLQADKTAIGETEKKLRGLTAELARLQQLKSSNVPVQGLNREIKKTETAIRATNSQLATQTKRFAESAKKAEALGINSKRTAQSIDQINVEAARTADLVRQSETAMNGYSEAVRGAREASREQQQAQRAITEEAQRRIEIENRAQAQWVKDARVRMEETRRLEQRRREATEAFSGPRGAIASATPLGPGNDAGARQAAAAKLAGAAAQRESEIRDRLVRVLARQKDGGDKLAAGSGRLAAATRQVSAALDKQRESMDRTHKLGGLLNDTGRKSLSVYQRLRGQLLATAAAYIGLYQAVGLVSSAVTAQQDRRRIDIQLRIANKGDVEAAKRDVDFLRGQADRLGLVYEDLAKNYANYKIAGQAVGLANKTIKSSFVNATEIVTGLGLAADDADGVFRAFVQILGKARVQAEELRGQLGDRLPGAVAKFAEANKIQLSQLDAYLKKGKGNVQNFLNFLRDYAATTKVGVEENSKTLFAQFNRLKNAYRDFLVTFAKEGVSSGLLDVVNQLIFKLRGNEGQKFAKELAHWFEYVGKVLLYVIENFDTFVTLVKYYLGLQLAKGVISLGASFVIANANIYKSVAAVVTWTKAMNTARVAGAALTLTQRGLLALLGPVGIALTAAGVALGYLTLKLNQATAETERLLEKMDQLQNMHGRIAVDGLRDLSSEIRKMGVEEKDLLDKRKKLLATIGVSTIAAPAVAAAARTALKVVDDQLGIVRSKINSTVKSVQATSKRLIHEAEQDSARAKKEAAEQDHVVDASPEATDKSDAAAKAAETAAERRRDIADRSARELLDIEKALLESRLNANITTQDQIDANLKESLAIIDVEMKKKRNELEALKHDAERAGSPEGVASAEKAISMLPQLQAEEEAKLRIKATTDGIELAEQKINELIAQRDAQIDIINTKVQLGLLSEVEGRDLAIAKQLEYKDQIVAGVDALTARLQALKVSDPSLAKMLHVDELIAKLEVTKIKSAEVVTTMQLIGKNLGGQLAQGATSFFSTFIKGATGAIEGVNGMADAFGNALNAFAEFLANFLVGIGEAILQAILLQAILNALGMGGGTTFKQAALGALTGHTGGVVGSKGIGGGNPIREVSAAVFAGAQRYHEGGLPGLKSDEVPAILRKREEVLTEDDPRNVLNGGGAQPVAPIDLTVHNHMDTGEIVSTGLRTNGAKREVRNVIASDLPAYKKMFGLT